MDEWGWMGVGVVIARGSWECRVSGVGSHVGAGGRESGGVLTTAFNHLERPDRDCKVLSVLTAVLCQY